ncbi:hypothetical protein [Streptomyces prunicolor]
MHDWFISKGVLPDNRLAAFLLGDYTHITALMHPASSPERLERISRYYTLWFAMEERNEALWQQPGAVQQVFVDVLEFLATGRTASTDPWVLAYVETVEGLGLPPRLRRLHTRWKTDWVESEQRMAATATRRTRPSWRTATTRSG